MESKRLTELRNQLQEKQLEDEQAWSKLTDTWAAEKITKDSKINELKAALEMAREQLVLNKPGKLLLKRKRQKSLPR